MKPLIVLLILLLLFACGKKDEPSVLVIDENVCIQLTDTTEFKLYHYPYFSKEDWYNLSYDDKVKNRQLPENILKEMTMEQLFNHCMWWELAPDMLIFNTSQKGFVKVIFERFNGIQELYQRKDIHLFLEEKMKNIDAKNITSSECWFYNHLLEYIYVQQECLAHYRQYELVRGLDILFKKSEHLSYLTTVDSHKWGFYDLSPLMIGIGNIMILNEYKPFLEEIEKDMELKSFFDGRMEVTANIATKVSKMGTEFYNKLKNDTK